jgi:hypothetical protein
MKRFNRGWRGWDRQRITKGANERNRLDPPGTGSDPAKTGMDPAGPGADPVRVFRK